MNPYTFLVPLVSVFVGLAVTDVAKSLHVLLRARDRVRWDWLPLAAALAPVLSAWGLWWRLFSSADATAFLTLGGFLPLAAQLVVLYLLNAASLPDEVPASGLDLRAFYHANARYFWTLYAVFVAAFILQQAIGLATHGPPDGATPAEAVWTLAGTFDELVLFVGLAVVRRRWVHAVAVGVLLALMLVGWSGLSLIVPTLSPYTP